MAESGDKLRRLRANIDALEAEFCRTAREFPGSQAIEVGRATRVVSAPTRRALRARDQGCRWPGCDRPVEWTSPHHIRFWTRQGGPTNLANLVSVCHFHHGAVAEEVRSAGFSRSLAKGRASVCFSCAGASSRLESQRGIPVAPGVKGSMSSFSRRQGLPSHSGVAAGERRAA